MAREHSDDPPSAFVDEWVRRLKPGGGARPLALDVAMGRGRHAALLVAAGFATFGVDISLDAVREARRRAPPLRAWCADLTNTALPQAWFDVVIVTRYLQRNFFDALRDTVVPGGVVLYETFTSRQRLLGRGPTSADHLLAPGELRDRFSGFEVLFYDEVTSPDAVARIAARRPCG